MCPSSPSLDEARAHWHAVIRVLVTDSYQRQGLVAGVHRIANASNSPVAVALLHPTRFWL